MAGITRCAQSTLRRTLQHLSYAGPYGLGWGLDHGFGLYWRLVLVLITTHSRIAGGGGRHVVWYSNPSGVYTDADRLQHSYTSLSGPGSRHV